MGVADETEAAALREETHEQFTVSAEPVFAILPPAPAEVKPPPKKERKYDDNNEHEFML